MAGPRFLRQRRASLHSFKAVQIAEVLEARRLLAAVSDDGFIEAPQPEAAAAEAVVTENFVVTSEEYTEECLPEYYLEGEVAIDGPENSEFNDTSLLSSLPLVNSAYVDTTFSSASSCWPCIDS